MVTIDINIPIGPESENRWYAMWGEENVFFSLETIKRIFEENSAEKDFKFNINCDGGYVEDGFAIYDYMRTSGKNIYCNIEGGCHSMAVVLLLAAPAENRSAQKHATSLIHCVRCDWYGDATADDLRKEADFLEQQQEKILDIYADRTGWDKDELRVLMKEEKVRDTDFLMEHGFISSINSYTTNLRKKRGSGSNHINPKNETEMATKTKQEVISMASNFLAGLRNLLGNAAKNFDHTDADGNLLFSTEAEDDTLEVGMTASPDGTFELPDGRVVIIADGVITEINEPKTEEDEPETEENNAEMDALRNENESLRNQLAEAANVITELQSQLASNYVPKNAARTAPSTTPKNEETLEEHKAEQKRKLGIK